MQLFLGETRFRNYGETSTTGGWISLALNNYQSLKKFREYDEVHGSKPLHILDCIMGTEAFDSSDYQEHHLLKDELQLLDWSESRKAGATIKLRLNDPDLMQLFRGMDKKTEKKEGQLIWLSIRATDEVQEDKPKKRKVKGLYGQLANQLRLSSFFATLSVWKSVGSDEEYNQWVKRQPSALSNQFSEYHDNGDKFSIPAHVRRSGESGAGIKPLYATIPLTNDEHQQQHQFGEGSLFDGDEVKARDWFNRKRIEHVRDWCWDKLKTDLGYESWSQVPPGDLYQWAKKHDVDRHLPLSYQNRDRSAA